MTKISIITILLFFLAQTSLSQRQEILFFRYIMNLEMGFSSHCSYCLIQDKQGFIWIGTDNGLNRFDGYRAKVYRYEPGETGTISGNIIDCLFEDRSGMIWIGTRTSGLNMYNPYTDMFTTYRNDPNDPSTISSDRITAIHEDQFENLWIGTDNGLNLFDRGRKKFSFFKQCNKDNYVLTIFKNNSGKIWIGTYQGMYLFDNDKKAFISFEDYFSLPERLDIFSVYTGVIDHDGTFWIGTNRGLIRFNPLNQRFTHYPTNMDKKSSDFSNIVQTILLDETKNGTFLWIGTLNGLYKFDNNKEVFQTFVHNPLNDYSISHNNIQAILKDRSGCLWIGVKESGLNKASFVRAYIRHYFPNPLRRKSSENDIKYFCQSKSGILWFATPGGLWAFDKKSEIFTFYQHNPQDPNSLSDNDVRCIFEDIHGDIWVGTADGLNKFDGNNGFISYKHNPHNQNSLSNNGIQSISGTSDGDLVIGTWSGLNLFNPYSQKLRRYLKDPNNLNSLSENTIMSVLTDSNDIIWIGTEKGGLNRFNLRSGQFIHYKNDLEIPQSISSNSILTLFEYPVNHQQTLWIGTNGGGLCRYDKTTDTFIRYTKNDGLRSNIVRCITADFRGNLWLATQEGISILNLKSMMFRSFEMGIIIPRGINTCITDQNGEIFCGGWFGLARFFPDSIKLNTHIPEIILTDFKINNQPAYLDTVISYKQALKLTYKENFLSFEFSALDFNRPLSNLYAYQMVGIDPDWVVTDATRRYATYTDLDPGEYIFQVRGSNNDGIWNEVGISLPITITPPWWKTTWAYTIYLFLFGIMLYALRTYDQKRQRLKHALELEQLHTEKLEEVDRMKSHFFANISHEFRTPLTLILGPLERLLSHYSDEESQQELKIMQRSAQRLHRLINQLLDLSKLEAGKMKVQVCKENIFTLLHSFVQTFESLARLKKIELIFKSTNENITGYVDREKLETIINNLLSNAFKFAPEGGTVTIECGMQKTDSNKIKNSEFLYIVISNTRSYIPPSKIQYIFDRFHQADDSYTRDQEGTGIGLALTKELVEFHKGNIRVSSELDKGTTFVIQLPIGKEHFSPEEILDKKVEDKSELISSSESGFKEATDWDKTQIKPDLTKPDIKTKSPPVLLIVEDNPDMRLYIQNSLEDTYQILEAENGQQGFEKCKKKLPDLVISDVMMPKIDGFQLCTKIKTDPRTSHTPVILLTARAAEDDKIGGLEIGADDYLTKPFNIRELQLKVKNIIEQKIILRERFRHEALLQPKDIAVTSVDEQILNRAMKIIEQEISNTDLDVDLFMREMGISRAHLYCKIKALTGLSIKEFIRTIRLKLGAQMIEKRAGSIAEIAYNVGFSNPAYFAECFRKQFGLSPSQYALSKRQ